VIADLTRVILGLHGWAALAVIFGVPLAESSVFLGFVFPGEIAIMLGGVLASQHRLPANRASTSTGMTSWTCIPPCSAGCCAGPTSCNCAARLTSAHRSSRT
jgi:membrane protein DedA with SNARE-associated domain